MTSLNDGSPSDQASGIFISYRREETEGHVGRLHDVLNDCFPGGVFRDIDNIEAGQDFVEAIDDAVGRCKVLLVIIGKQWLSIVGPDGRRRLDDPGDFVRREVASALKRNVRVIPVLLKKADMPLEKDLPDELKDLSRHNAIEISDTRWAYDTQRLVEVLEKHVGPCRARAAKGGAAGGLGSQVRGITGKRTWVALAAVVLILAAAGLLTRFLLSGQNMKDSQASLPGPAASSQPSEADLKEQENINHALELAGRCMSAADVMLEMLTSPDYDPRTFHNNKKIEASIEKQLGEATDKFNQAVEDLKGEQYKSLTSRHPEVEASWQDSQKAVMGYMDCVSDLEEAKGNNEPVDKFHNCEDKKQAAGEHMDQFKKSIEAARR